MRLGRRFLCQIGASIMGPECWDEQFVGADGHGDEKRVIFTSVLVSMCYRSDRRSFSTLIDILSQLRVICREVRVSVDGAGEI